MLTRRDRNGVLSTETVKAKLSRCRCRAQCADHSSDAINKRIILNYNRGREPKLCDGLYMRPTGEPPPARRCCPLAATPLAGLASVVGYSWTGWVMCWASPGE